MKSCCLSGLRGYASFVYGWGARNIGDRSPTLGDGKLDKNEVCQQFEPLVRATAAKYRAVSYEDALQAGRVALLEAIESYRPEMGVPFAGYAAAKVRGDVRTAMRREWTYAKRNVRGGSGGGGGGGSRGRAGVDGPSDREAWDVVGSGAAGLGVGAVAAGIDAAAAEYSLVEWRMVMADANLSPRERLSLDAIVDGMSCSEVAARYGVSVETVKTWRKRGLGKIRKVCGE